MDTQNRRKVLKIGKGGGGGGGGKVQNIGGGGGGARGGKLLDDCRLIGVTFLTLKPDNIAKKEQN